MGLGPHGVTKEMDKSIPFRSYPLWGSNKKIGVGLKIQLHGKVGKKDWNPVTMNGSREEENGSCKKKGNEGFGCGDKQNISLFLI
ncbi:hypothetical protein TNIN_4791 [Trichonephila inaurata madagascariensis]|uniref:Uncharacterized protein n=1 Tax=Trichonephila inaurata madagascariensis TaxID=2747483 RepID=A0A8X6Y8L5_9ARAC|nr:hypothetical protein TNIN_4791 [Trichonephila inaurata madagascariensis]